MNRPPIRCAILTISDRCARGEQEDRSGPALREVLAAWGWEPETCEVLADDEYAIAERLASLADQGFDLVVTTGGTGLGPRDRTPEATLRVADRLIPGLAELVRARTGGRCPRAYLSRGVAATRENCLLLNLPGSPNGAREGLEALVDLLPHALEVIHEVPGERGPHETSVGPGEDSIRS